MTAHTIVAPPKPAPSSDRVERYETNLDKALAIMADEGRARDYVLKELRDERIRWIARYEEFVASLDRGCPAPWGGHVNDYVLVIALLGKRIAEHERLAEVANAS
jgi:hypothetical protein